jgi:glycosyltransferase involved in cell wall biosynthesis
MKVAVIIPAYNEAPSISKVVNAIPLEINTTIIVVNNGSTDNTVEEATRAGAIVLNESRKGYGWACLKGIEYAQKDGADILVFMDGDFSDYPSEMSLLIDPIAAGKMDFVLGSRVLGERERGSLTPQQVFGNWLATRMIRIFYGARFSDLGPFRAIRTDALNSLKMSDKTYGWTIEMQIKAVKNKLRFCEIPVTYRKRIGVSKVSGTVKGTVRAGIKIIWAVFKYRF